MRSHPHPLPARARTAWILAAGAMAMAPFAVADPARPEWLDIRPRTGGSLEHPTQAVLVGTRVVVADAGQVKAVTLPEGHLDVLFGRSPSDARTAPAARRERQDAWGLAVDSQGRLTVALTSSHQVVRWTPEAGMQLLLGLTGGQSGRGKDRDGKAGPQYGLDRPMGLASGPEGTIYVADSENHQLLERKQGGRTRVLAGPEPVARCPLAGAGAGVEVRIRQPRGLVAAPDGSLLFTTANPPGVWRRKRGGAIEPLPGLVDPEAPSFSPSQDSQRHADSLNCPSGLVLGPDGSVLVADPLEDRVWLQRPAGGKVQVELPPGCGSGGARLISVSGIDHGGVVLTAEGRMWVSFPWRDAKAQGPSRGDRDGPPRTGDGKAEDPASRLFELAATLHGAHQPRPAAAPRPMAGDRMETKAAPAAGAVASAAPRPVRVESSQPDAAPPAGPGGVAGEPPAGTKRPKREESQVDASPLPASKRPRREKGGMEAAAAEASGAGSQTGARGAGPGSPARKVAASASQEGSLNLRLDLSEDLGRPPAAPESPEPDLEAGARRDPDQAMRALVMDEVGVRRLMTFEQADTVESWLREHLPGLQPSRAERISLAERTGLRTSYIGELLEAVRGIMAAAADAGPSGPDPLPEWDVAPPNGNPMDWQE